jgi:starch synthase
MLGEGMQLGLLGSGDAELQDHFRAAAAANPGRIGAVIGYDEALAHLIQAGADALAVPSRFEPCGLTQLCALRYGAVPIVSRVGGLDDTVVDVGDTRTGFKFESLTAEGLIAALHRANALFRDARPSWRQLQFNGMSKDVSWHGSARLYADTYRGLLGMHA